MNDKDTNYTERGYFFRGEAVAVLTMAGVSAPCDPHISGGGFFFFLKK